ncbi:Uncharacterised protein [Vibrio cholerae]|nr:Uncharacterised protein [Vibrio cholerae]
MKQGLAALHSTTACHELNINPLLLKKAQLISKIKRGRKRCL